MESAVAAARAAGPVPNGAAAMEEDEPPAKRVSWHRVLEDMPKVRWQHGETEASQSIQEHAQSSQRMLCEVWHGSALL